MNSKEWIKELYREREYLLADKVNNKGSDWSESIKHYDNIGKALLEISKDLEMLEILKKWIVVNETNDDLFPYEIKVKNGYLSNKSCLVLIEEDYKKIKEWLNQWHE